MRINPSLVPPARMQAIQLNQIRGLFQTQEKGPISGSGNEVIDLTGRHTAKIIGTYEWQRIVE